MASLPSSSALAVITQDELFSDAYDIIESDEGVVEVNCQMITIKEGDVDIGAWQSLFPQLSCSPLPGPRALIGQR
jgi:hypothetical protein